MLLPTLNDVGDLRGKKVLLRLDLNVPVENGEVTDAYRILRVEKTLAFLKESGARTLIISHMEGKGGDSLQPAAKYLSKKFDVSFALTLVEAQEQIASLQEGSFVLLENLRTWEGEKKNDPAFAQELASLADIYVNDAFAVSHREHASIVGVPKLLPSFAGFLMSEEVEALSKALAPEHPALLILGGAKFETKLPLAEKFLNIVDHLYLCGALANDIYKARGYEVGTSIVSNGTLSLEPLLNHPKVLVPVDVIAVGEGGRRVCAADEVKPDEKIEDAGPNALADVTALIGKSAFVLWNGPLGEYEEGFDEGTVAVELAIAESDAESIIGGGDSLAVASKLNLLERFSFVSTGGGAMLDFLAHGTLPGIEALRIK
ncbi:MAG: phosphoglycerate kinase [bacterium]|nr:phosphoglycerate kinase [bacterium]